MRVMEINIEDYEGIQVIIRSGDRDWVGTTVTVKDVQPNGDCKMTDGGSYFNENVKRIQMDPNGKCDGYEFDYIKTKTCKLSQ